MTSEATSFEQLPLARTTMQMSLAGQYRIYTDHKNFKLVQADSAVNALEQSGIARAFKIERETLYKNTLIAPNFPQAEAPAISAPV